MEKQTTQYWYNRTIEHLMLIGKSERTAQTYAREVRILGEYLDKALENADEEDLRKFILYRRNDCNLGGSSMRILFCGLKCLYQDVIGKNWPLLEILKSNRPKHLPTVISRDEVGKILEHARTPAHMTYLRVVYSCGLRLSEALNLTVNDIDSERGFLIVRGGKGSKDRFVPLPLKTYYYLKHYWRLHKNPKYLFPAVGRNFQGGFTATKPMAVSTVQSGLRQAVKHAGIVRQGISLHTLRHSYATHLLENGLSIKVVQENLGHASLQHTVVYLHLTNWGREDAFNKINKMMGDI